MKARAASSRYYMDYMEASELLGVGVHKAGDIVRHMRQDLIDEGKLTPDYPRGKVPRAYFLEKCMIGTDKEEEQ